MKSFDASQITYAISLHFSQDVNDIISQTVASIAETTGNRFIIENKIPPHVTIGAFHATKETEPNLVRLAEDFSRNQKAGLVRFTEIENFNGKVLFLKPEKDAFLSEMNRKLHDLVLPEFEKGENGYYTPQIWFPHTTLATRLNPSQFSKALSVAEKIPLPLTAESCELSLYQCSPFLEVRRLQLVL